MGVGCEKRVADTLFRRRARSFSVGISKMKPIPIIPFIFFVISVGVLSIGWPIHVEAAEPSDVMRWTFDSEQSSPLELHGLESHGDVRRDQAGPRPPEFPDFATNNTAIELDGGGYVSIDDEVGESRFDFDNDDEITLEAWVRLDRAREGQQMYVIGKGRTGSPKFRPDNQNWAMRTVAHQGIARISFLFATERTAGKSHWHRWTSEKGFVQKSGWHHIAVAYRFGDPESIRGWIDGQSVSGVWDMGGATKLPPVVDDDAVWVGSASRGNPSNSFDGAIDEVAIHRSVLSDKTIASRFNRLGGPQLAGPQAEKMPSLDAIPSGKVFVSLHERLPTHTRWLNVGEELPSESLQWNTSAFFIHRVPRKYSYPGLRDGWDAPVLIRMAGDVTLPPGENHVLVRARSLSRLWIDGKVVARTKAARSRGGNLQPIVPVPEPPAIGHRRLPFPQQETIESFVIDASQAENKSVRVVWELVVGGKGRRTESGEACVAFQTPGQTDFNLLTASGALDVPMVDEAIERQADELEATLFGLETQQRRLAATKDDAFWEKRHRLAKQVVAERSATTDGFTNIDGFIADKIRTASRLASQHDESTTQNFHQNVLPILEDNCVRCHGEKQKGGLRLNSREAALMAGESELPAIVPGDPDASELIVQIRDRAMPPTEEGLSNEKIAILEQWVADGAVWPATPIDQQAITMGKPLNDFAWLRRLSLDLIGVIPDSGQLSERATIDRREVIDQLLDDPRFADHWVSFWMDLLAENPTLLNQSMGSTGPFRYYLHDSLVDHKPLDRMITELISMRGDAAHGGPAGFAMAGENDSPMAAKAHILASALLGVELQCARCHDSPYHNTTQEDLYSLAAMLQRKPITPPKTSRVPDAFFENQVRESLIRVTLPLGQAVDPVWPLSAYTGIEDSSQIEPLVMNPDDSRERLAALITSPENERFPNVIVNHLWNRLMGAGFVEPLHDWEGRRSSHPELLKYLAEALVANGFDMRHVIRLIVSSEVYGRDAIGDNRNAKPEARFFASPDRRRMSAEQIVDSLFVATGREMDTEELTFVHDGSLPLSKRGTLGKPKKAWMFASLNNERDRPSLAMPKAQPIVDVLEAFGWNGARQMPIVRRDTDPNVLQPGILANGSLTMSLSRAAKGSELAELALNATDPDTLLHSLFMRFLTRPANEGEREYFGTTLSQGFSTRNIPVSTVPAIHVDDPLPVSTWSNHLVSEANEIQQEHERRVRRGPTPDPRLDPQWRELYEDVIWSLINHDEFAWMP